MNNYENQLQKNYRTPTTVEKRFFNNLTIAEIMAIKMNIQLGNGEISKISYSVEY